MCPAGLGQLLVWEWQSESYVLKQQGHFHSMASLAYSPDGQYIVTGSDDGKVGLGGRQGLGPGLGGAWRVVLLRPREGEPGPDSGVQPGAHGLALLRPGS